MITKRITVLGSGAFGTALAHVASHCPNSQVRIHMMNPEHATFFNAERRNKGYKTDYQLKSNVSAINSVQEALRDTNLVISALPTQIVADFLQENLKFFPSNIPFVSCSKGMVISKQKFLSEAVHQVTGNQFKYAALSGPSFAEEILQERPTCVVVASRSEEVSKEIQKTLSTKFFRIYTQDDVLGVEIAGALKNVLAIGAGISQGQAFGYNAQAALLTRGTREIQKFAVKYGAKEGTLSGLAGIGDIMLTAYGTLSRNMTLGYRLGKGEKLEDIIKTSKGIVEGLPTLEAVLKYSREHNIEMPIFESINKVIYGKLSIKEAIEQLMLRDQEPEFTIVREE